MKPNNKPLSLYPRPQLKRDSYLCLNGLWDYAIKQDESIPMEYDGKILVPFSPETELSGVNRVVGPKDWLFYHLEFEIDSKFIKDKVILHFTAVDQIADVYINGEHLGQHVGGYLPFEFDIKPHLKDINHLVVKVKDFTDESYHSRGKQKIKRGGIWYTPQSGIYLPVWLESVSNDYIKNIKLTPDIDSKCLKISVFSSSKTAKVIVENKEHIIETNIEATIPINNLHLWSPEDPYLYDLKISTKDDEIVSYFAMRKISLVEHNGHKVIALNNKPYFMKGVLDQGYYKKGLYTPENYDDYFKDIALAKSLGFNTIRKHIKIEAPIWYYECDKSGMLVWQDFINGGGKYKASTVMFPLITGIHHDDTKHSKFSRQDENGRNEAKAEFKEIIDYLYNVPSIVLWTIFNEGWGQFDSKEIYEEVSSLDSTRLFDHASGWHDQGISDVKSLHVYFKSVKIPKAKIINNRSVVLSEFGGYVLPIKGHMQKGKPTYRSYKNTEQWVKAFEKSINRDVIANIPLGLSASIYTQLSDVEDELNGFITYDREVEKVDPSIIKNINDKIHF